MSYKYVGFYRQLSTEQGHMLWFESKMIILVLASAAYIQRISYRPIILQQSWPAPKPPVEESFAQAQAEETNYGTCT